MKAAPAKRPAFLLRLRHRAHILFTRLDRLMKRLLTPAGAMLVFCILVFGALGPDSQYSEAAYGFTLSCSLLVVAVLSRPFLKPRLLAERTLPAFATAGEQLSYRIRIRNLSARHIRGLSIRDAAVDEMPGLEDYLAAREPGEESRNWLDRGLGYYRWLWLVSRSKRADFARVPVPDIPAGGEVEVFVPFSPLRRGSLVFDRVDFVRSDPFSLLRFQFPFPLPGFVTVLPRRFPVPPFSLPGESRHNPGGEVMAASVGESSEFAALREYRPGDPMRKVHWKSTARLLRPIVREHQEEYFVRHALVLDTFLSGLDDEKLEDAVSIAASLACRMPGRESLLDFLFVGERAYCFTAGRGLRQTGEILEILAAVSASRHRPFSDLSDLVASRAHLVSGCVLVLLDWDVERRRLVELVRGFGRPLRVFVLRDAGAEAPLEAGPMAGIPEQLVSVPAGKAAEILGALS